MKKLFLLSIATTLLLSLAAQQPVNGKVTDSKGLSTQPGYHYSIENRNLIHHSIEQVLSRPAKRYWVGHGGPLSRADVARWYHTTRK